MDLYILSLTIYIFYGYGSEELFTEKIKLFFRKILALNRRIIGYWLYMLV